MSIKGKGQTLYIGKSKVTLKELLEKDIVLTYDLIRHIEYQYSENINYGFMRFKLTTGNTVTFVFSSKSNEQISRAIDYIINNAPKIEIKEVKEKFYRKERAALWSMKKKAIPIVIFLLALLIYAGGIFYSMNVFSSLNKSDQYITLEEYNDCITGMTYDECVKIIGSKGEPMAETNILDVTSKAYIWYGDSVSGSNATMYFMDDKLYSKAQIGLH